MLESMRGVKAGLGTGFGVDPAALAGVSGQIGKAYDDVGGAVADFRASEGLSPEVLGDFGVGDAWAGFNAAWSNELDVTRAALAELVGKVSATAQRYEENEAAIIASVNRVGAGG
jgi:hypothetical protein